MNRVPRSGLSCLLAASAALALAGCVEQTSTSAGGSGFRPATSGALAAGAPTSNVKGSTFTASLQAGIFALGSIPYDNFTLPLVEPRARYIATEAGIAPVRDTALAGPGAPVPEATRVEIYRLDAVENQAQMHAVLGEPVVLGRSCDVNGVLVEAQRHDGSRWIGKASWTTGAIEWLVQGYEVNAFASLGPNGQLAWSRRNAEGSFDLVVRLPDGREWTLSSGADNWLLPTWSGRDDGLFVARLNGGVLDLVHAQATSGQTFRQSLMRMSIVAGGAVMHTAYQMMIVQPGSFAGRTAEHPEQLVFHHPIQLRAMVWRPHSFHRNGITPFRDRSYTAVMDQPHLALVATDKDLWRASLLDLKSKAKLLAGLYIPRQTDHTDIPFVLLEPHEGRIDLVGMKLLSPEDADNATAKAD